MIGVAASVGKQVFAFGPAGSASMRITSRDLASPAMSQLRAALQPERFDRIIREEAIRTHAEVVRKTPRKWTGELRRRWQMKQLGLGAWEVLNQSPIMGYLEYGTANGGTGYIYPKRAKALFIPLTRKAAMMDRSLGGTGIGSGGQYNQRIGSGKKTRFRLHVLNAGVQHNIKQGNAYRIRMSTGGGYKVFTQTKTGVYGSKLLVRGVDYILAQRVRGIRPMKIAEKQRVVTAKRLQRRMVNYIRQHLRGGAGA